MEMSGVVTGFFLHFLAKDLQSQLKTQHSNETDIDRCRLRVLRNTPVKVCTFMKYVSVGCTLTISTSVCIMLKFQL